MRFCLPQPTACPGCVLWLGQRWLSQQGFQRTLELRAYWSPCRRVCGEISSSAIELQSDVVKTLTLSGSLYFLHRNFVRLLKVKGLRDASLTFPESPSIYFHNAVHVHVELWTQVQFLFPYLWRGLMDMLALLSIISEISLGVEKAGRLGDPVLRETKVKHLAITVVTGHLSQDRML